VAVTTSAVQRSRGFGATGLIVERLVGPVLALPIAAAGGIAFEAFVCARFSTRFSGLNPARSDSESALMSEGRAVTGFDATAMADFPELGGELVQVLVYS